MLEYKLAVDEEDAQKSDSFKEMLINNTFYQPGVQDMFWYVYNFEEDGYVYGESCNVDGSMTWGEKWSSPYTVQGTSVTFGDSITYFYKENLGILATDVVTIWDQWNEVYSKEVMWLVPYNGPLSIDTYNKFANYYFELID